MAGFVLQNNLLIVSGALVGAAGLILTNIMCKAMNRSLSNVIFGSFGVTAGGSTGIRDGNKNVHETSAEDLAIQVAYASKVVIVPGYGLAVAQAQHIVKEMTPNSNLVCSGQIRNSSGCRSHAWTYECFISRGRRPL